MLEIDKETQESIQDFVKVLTGVSNGAIRQYVSEIISDKKFHDSIAQKGNEWSGTKKSFSFKILAVDLTSCVALYALCRSLEPAVVVETGVASGVSSAYILCALDRNNRGELFSIDVPWHTVTENWKPHFTDEDMRAHPIEKQSGWIIPDYLRNRWQLLLGKSSENLPPLLKKISPIDVFFHDSEHSYETMFWEFQMVWPSLRVGGLLIAHNIDINDAFSDFKQSVGGESVQVTGVHKELAIQVTLGGMVKI